MGHPPNSVLINESIASISSVSMASSSTQEVYKRRALIIAFGSTVLFGGNDERRSTKHESERIANSLSYQQ